jgi:peroxiredoxin
MADKEILGDKFEPQMINLRNDYKSLIKSVNLKRIVLIKDNLSFVVSADRLRFTYRKIEIKEAKAILNSLKGNAMRSPSYLDIKEEMLLIENVEIGKKAPDFTMQTSEGKELSLSYFKGKLLILDFWASWCGPCRRENPNVVKLYNKYHSKGLEVLSVSLDKNKERWLKAIKDDNLIWNHVSDLKAWNSKVAKLYTVQSIPHIILINRKGTIVAKNLRGEELEKKIQEYIK